MLSALLRLQPVLICFIDQQCERPLSIFAEGVRLVSLRFLPMRKSRVSINGSAQLLHCEFDNSSVWVGPNAHFIMRHSRIREVEDIGLLLLPNTQSVLENSVIDGATIGLSAFLSDQTDTIAAVVTHCRIGNCSQAGISASGRSVRLELSHNEIIRNRGPGLLVRDSCVSLRDNRLMHNRGQAVSRNVLLVASERNLLEGNARDYLAWLWDACRQFGSSQLAAILFMLLRFFRSLLELVFSFLPFP
jgi:hypothetical protein